MIGFMRKLAAATLRASGREDLQAAAGWVENAEDEIVRLIAAVLAESMKGDQDISVAAANEVLRLKVATIDKPPASRVRSPHPYLDEYVECLRTVVDVGCWHRYLVLQGFVHSFECASLWTFDLNKAPTVGLFKSAFDSSIVSIGLTNCEVTLASALTEADLKRINTMIGRPSPQVPQEFAGRSVQKVTQIEEGRVRTIVIAGRDRTTKFVEIDSTWSGFESMAESLPVALAARGETLHGLRAINRA